MPKIGKTCVRCGASFEVWPSRIKWQEQRGIEIKFCSRECTAAARAEKLIRSRPREGEYVPCSTCGKQIYRKQFKLNKDTLHFCSQKCRVLALSEGRIDRKFEQANEKKRTGRKFSCCICGSEKYRRISYFMRNVNKTCGKPECVSAYARSRWGLDPCPDSNRRKSGKRGLRPRRATNFTAKQRVEWMDAKCKRCGSDQNLTLDHILAVCCGGKSVRENAQTLCGPCNNWKAEHIDKPLARAMNKLQKAA